MIAALALLLASGAAAITVETGLPPVHLQNLALLAAMPTGGLPLPLTSGRSLAGLGSQELQAAYAKAAGFALPDIPVLPVLPQLQAAAAVNGGADMPAADGRTGSMSQVAALQQRPGTSGGGWQELAQKFDGLGASKELDESRSARGPPKQVASGLLVVSDAPQPTTEKLERWLGGAKPEGFSWAYLNIDLDLARELLEQIGAPGKVREAVAGLHAGAGADEHAAYLDSQPDWAARFLRKRHEMEGAMYESFPDLPALVTAWRARGADAAVLRAVLDDAFEIAGGIRVVLSARSWARLSESQRRAAAEALNAGPIRKGGKLFLELGPGADFAALAAKYAAGRDPRPLERLLRRAAARGDKRLALEKILPGHIRGRLGSFAECTGPNCVNSVMSKAAVYDDGSAIVARLGAGHDRMPPETKPLPGDKLVYTSLSKELVHVAESVGDGWVFTKNGLGRHYPYLFQEQAAMEAVHFPSGEFRLIVFRPRPAK